MNTHQEEICFLCKKNRDQVKHLLKGPKICMCNECVMRAIIAIAQNSSSSTKEAEDQLIQTVCWFCNKSAMELSGIAVFENANICFGCLCVAFEVILQEEKDNGKLVFVADAAEKPPKVNSEK